MLSTINAGAVPTTIKLSLVIEYIEFLLLPVFLGFFSLLFLTVNAQQEGVEPVAGAVWWQQRGLMSNLWLVISLTIWLAFLMAISQEEGLGRFISGKGASPVDGSAGRGIGSLVDQWSCCQRAHGV
jgi:hypothetical protein